MTKGLLFSIQEMLHELDSAKRLAEPFLENASTVFGQLQTQLENIRNANTDTLMTWQIPREYPLRTRVSEGECEKGSGGRRMVGTLSFIWEVVRVHPRKRKLPARQFKLLGKASTTVRVFHVNNDGEHGQELAMWKTEIGDSESPGCHFHVHILGESDDPPYPIDLPVPRLPTCLATPMATMEFMLGELFQDSWTEHISMETDALKTWRNIQNQRMRRLFEWQSELILASGRTPWAVLKAAKPKPSIFIE